VLDDIFPKINTLGGADMELFITTVHGVKSALANVGETKLSDFAFRLERAGNSGDMDVISAEIPDFINAIQSFIEDFKSAKINGDTELSHDDMVFLRENLSDIKIACENFDMKTAKTALEVLQQRTWPRELSDMIDVITMNLLCGDYKDVV
jgi:HPt (histidine-containing phosphotransfer) domain-containing protein